LDWFDSVAGAAQNGPHFDRFREGLIMVSTSCDTLDKWPVGKFQLLLAMALLAFVGLSQAHHGWSWTKEGAFQLVGVVEKATLGNPHGVLVMDAEGEKWIVEVGQPWRNERAGLTDAMLAPGAELTLVGKRSLDSKDKKMKAERVIIKGRRFDLYPERLQ
jgi:hypothetical protein